jgi:tetratricopeptide repeat protein
MIRSITITLILLIISLDAFAQDEARAAWQVNNFDITVNSLAERALVARAVLNVKNVGRGAGATLSLRVNPKTEIKNVTIGGATASYQSVPEPRNSAQRVTVKLPSPIAANDGVSVTVEYRLPLEDNAGTASISPVASHFLPMAFWYPSPNTAYAVRGADYAPFRLTINGGNAISSGADKSAAGNSIFEQSLNGQPFFVVGNWDRVDGAGAAKGIAAYLPKGLGEDERKQAESLMSLAADARAFFASILGTAPEVPIRLVATRRGGGFDDAGTVLLSEGAFRRRKIDSVTALAIAEAMARLWIGADTPVRGEGHGVLREGLVRFMATQFFEKQFGADVAAEERARERMAYEAIAKRDAPLSRTTPLEATYFSSVSNKGAMVWRLAYNLIGQDQFNSALRELLAAGKTDPAGLSLARVRAVMAQRGGSGIGGILNQEFDQPTDMDLMVGLPQQQAGQWTAALRNLGSFEARVSVVATTASGQRLVTETTIPAQDFGQVKFQSPAALVRIEVDPDKLYPQLDYANDAAPRSVEVTASLAEATRLFGTQEFGKSEALVRQLLQISPRMQEARVLLARALLAQNKIDDAEREFRALAEERLPTPAALAWTNVGMGEIALKRGQAKEASRFFNQAVRDDAEYGSTLSARAARIRADAAAGATPIDEGAKTFLGQFDTALRAGRQAEIAALIVPGELSRFVRSAVGTQPEIWQTTVLRTEQLDANTIAADVAMQTRQLGVDHHTTAVIILARVGSAWKVNAIEFVEEIRK